PPLGTTLEQYANAATNSYVMYPLGQPGAFAAAQAQYYYVVGLLIGMGASQEALERFAALNSNLLGLTVEGGNIHFNNQIGMGESGNPILLFNFGCDSGRCDNGLDFSHDQGTSFHADTANPYLDAVNALEHFAVDVIGGY